MDLTYERSARLAKLIDDYKQVDAFMSSSMRMSYVQFDYAVSHELPLFGVDPDLDFDELERRTDEIISVMPAIKRIFAQPLIHLKEQDVVLPVDSVRIINNNTLTHIASHSELWTDLKDDEIKPEKLLTRTYEDNYAIYENKVFCNVVDDILAFTRAQIRFLKELIYTNRTIEINLLERVNHLNYFLALGKLHIGYSRSFESYYAVSERCLNKLQYIAGSIVPRLKRPVYKNNKNRPANLKIRKTNILSMHKEYHQVYKYAKSLVHGQAEQVQKITAKDYKALLKCYEFFCRALCIFAIGHFNFACDEKKVFDLSRARLDFAFKKWKLKLETFSFDDRKLIALEIVKDKPYQIVLIPSLDEDGAELYRSVKTAVKADEYILCSPFGKDEKPDANNRDDIVEKLIGITSIESFRRIQQIVLRGMIYSDLKHDDCPFCSNAMSENPDKSAAGGKAYECVSCRTEVHEATCAETGKQYYFTKIAELSPPQADETDEWLAELKDESKAYFRNITEMDDELNPVCPHCGKVH